MERALEDLTPDEVIDLIRAAQMDIKEAHTLFNMMVEPELIDYAIHKMGAAENRYRYLIRWARERNLSLYDH
ncbi:MAG: DUF2508 family protein [Firmicutes bacterium]|nr:DUF2508 family protein [Bacillota bacterium]